VLILVIYTLGQGGIVVFGVIRPDALSVYDRS